MIERICSRDANRRRFLKNGFRIMAACSCLPLFELLSGCQEEEAPPQTGPLVVPLAMVPEGQRTQVEHHGVPVELVRTGEGVTARSLLCTHQGCKVVWHEDRQLYICPCHEGKFDINGEVVYGMPRKPLNLLKVTVQAGQVIVDG